MMRQFLWFLLVLASGFFAGSYDGGLAGESRTRQQRQVEENPPVLRPGEAAGVRIAPGMWRPHYPYEQIVWISPPWPSADYIWLDFPEAIFSDQGLLYLSHVNSDYPPLFPDLPRTPWREIPNGVAFERQLPNGVRFGGRVVKTDDTTVALELHIENGSPRPLTNIRLQTCGYLRAIREFADFTNDNKFVHLPGQGWQSLRKSIETRASAGRYAIGFRGIGLPGADLPVIAALSSLGQRFVTMTWFDDTLSLTGNYRHPCFHADPGFADLSPGEYASIEGTILFFEGTLDQLEARMKASRSP